MKTGDLNALRTRDWSVAGESLTATAMVTGNESSTQVNLRFLGPDGASAGDARLVLRQDDESEQVLRVEDCLVRLDPKAALDAIAAVEAALRAELEAFAREAGYQGLVWDREGAGSGALFS